MPLPQNLLCLFAISWLGIGLAAGAERVLLEKGSSGYEIVCPGNGNAATQLAARELRIWVRESSGVDLPAVIEPTPGKAHLFIGENPWSAQAGVSASGLKPEGYRMRTIGPDIHIVGVDVMRGSLDPKRNSATQTGTLSGVYDFLERHLGVLFLWHDKLGTIVPKHDRVTVPDLAIETAPAWTYRHLAYSPEGQTIDSIFGRRLRLGHGYTVAHSHSWFQIAPIEKYGKDHPDWYAEIDGKRQPAYYMEHHGGQVCTTNPAVVELFANAAIEFFNAQPSRDMFSLSPNDGGGFCTCAACRALDHGSSLTDRLITFYNGVAERVAKVHPDKLLGAYAYSYYRDPPVKVAPHKNLYLVYATNTAFHQGVGWPQEQENEKKWRAVTRHFAKYDIYYLPDSSLNLIAPMTRHLVERVRSEVSAGLEGGYLYMGQSYEQLGAGHYLLAQLMWDPKADAAALEQRYYQALYGPAADAVQSYYNLLESRLVKVRNAPLDTASPAVRVALRKRPGLGSHAYMLAAYAPVLDEASALMAKARSASLDADQQARLQRLIDQHELLVTTIRGLTLSARLETEVVPSADAAELLKLIDQREAVRLRLKSYAPSLCQSLDAGDAAETQALNPRGALAQFARVLRQPRDSEASTPFSHGNLENVTAASLEKDLRAHVEGGATLTLDTATPGEGKQSLRGQVLDTGYASITLTAKVKPATAYRITVSHWNDPAPMPSAIGDEADAITRGELPMAPRTRVIFRGPEGKSVVKNEWNAAAAHERVREWSTLAQLIRTPEDATQISFTIFLQFPGTYRLDDVRLQELGSAP